LFWNDTLKIFKGEIWLEVMIMKESGFNEARSGYLKKIIELIAPDKVQLVSPVRIKDSKIHALPKERMLEIKQVLGHNCQIF